MILRKSLNLSEPQFVHSKKKDIAMFVSPQWCVCSSTEAWVTVHAEPAVCCHCLLCSNLGITLVHDSEHGLSSRDSVDLPSGFGLGFGTGVRAL